MGVKPGCIFGKALWIESIGMIFGEDFGRNFGRIFGEMCGRIRYDTGHVRYDTGHVRYGDQKNKMKIDFLSFLLLKRKQRRLFGPQLEFQPDLNLNWPDLFFPWPLGLGR